MYMDMDMNMNMDYISNDNKGLLWGILQESNVFEGLRNEKFNEIKSIFDNTIYRINSTNPQKSIMEKNKMTIEELIKRINEIKKVNEPKIKVIYRAEDIQRERANELNNKLQKYQDEMNNIGKVKKPEEINFSDKDWNIDDKPIGDEMDRLISEKMASRERELEIPTITSDAEKWINNGNGRDNIEKKKVTFMKDNTEINVQNNTSGDKVVDNIFNILKRKTKELDNNNKPSQIKSNEITPSLVNRNEDLKSMDNNSMIFNLNTEMNNHIRRDNVNNIQNKIEQEDYQSLKLEINMMREKQELILNICQDILKSVKLLHENNIRK